MNKRIINLIEYPITINDRMFQLEGITPRLSLEAIKIDVYNGIQFIRVILDDVIDDGFIRGQ